MKWKDHYNKLVDYKNKHRHANRSTSEGQLGAWCKNQRALFLNKMRNSGEFLPLVRPTLQCANLPAMPDLPAWPDMPALLEMSILPDMQILSTLAILPDSVPNVPNVIAVYQNRELGRSWAWCLVEYHHCCQCGQRRRRRSNISTSSKLIWEWCWYK